MSQKARVEAMLAAGSAAMLAAMGEDIEVYDPRTGVSYEVTAHFEGLGEMAELGEGGFALEHAADAWWARTETPEPEVGWLVKVSGRVLRVRQVVDDPLDAEWEVRLEAA